MLSVCIIEQVGNIGHVVCCTVNCGFYFCSLYLLHFHLLPYSVNLVTYHELQYSSKLKYT